MENIFLFVPNLIGYARIFLSLLSFYFMPFDHVKAACLYILSALLDAFDGHAARAFNQSTKFGAMLDQLTDRCSTMCLLMTLGTLYPKYMFFFQLSVVIDIASHWLYLHVSTMQGKKSHKFIDPGENPIMHLYYTSRPVLFTMCAGNELFFTTLYLIHFTTGPIIFGVSLLKAIFIISTPIMVAKTLISLLHLYVASINLSIIDVEERKSLHGKVKDSDKKLE